MDTTTFKAAGEYRRFKARLYRAAVLAGLKPRRHNGASDVKWRRGFSPRQCNDGHKVEAGVQPRVSM